MLSFFQSEPKVAGIYRFPRDYVVASYRGSTGYPYVEYDWAAFPLSIEPAALGAATKRALSSFKRSKSGSVETGHIQLISERTGVPKSRLAISKAALVSIKANKSGIEIKPQRNHGLRGDDRGFHEMPETIQLLRPTDTQLGDAILAAFGRTESRTNSVKD
jgi:hypothetical protein